MKKAIVFFIFFSILIPTLSLGASLHKVHLDWDYDDQAVEGESLVGFRLYKEGVLIAQINDPSARSADCRLQSEEGTFTFTLTALYSRGTETPHSSPYTFTLSPSTLVVDEDHHELLGTYRLAGDLIDGQNVGNSMGQSTFATDFSGMEEAGVALSPVLIYPHVVVDENWETEICIVNTNQSLNLRGVLQPYGSDGVPLADSLTLNLSPDARFEFKVRELFAEPQRIAYLVLAANHGQAVGSTKFFIEDQCRIAVPAAAVLNQGDFSLPLTVSAQDWWTLVCLVNTTTVHKTLTFRFDNDVSRQISLAPGEHKSFTIASLFDDGTDPGINAAVVENGAGIVGYELFGGNHGTWSWGIPLSDRLSSDLYYPLVDGQQDWWSAIVAYNPVNQPTTLTITSYDEGGAVLFFQDITLDAYGTYLALASDLHLPSGTTCVHVHSSVEITGFELVGGAASTGSVNAANPGRYNGTFSSLNQDDEGAELFMMNGTAEPAHVVVTAYDDAGMPVSRRELLVPAFAEIGDSLLPDDDLSAATHFTYQSSVPLVACQYNHSGDGRMLDAMPVL